MSKTEKPTVTERAWGGDVNQVFSHPAFGVITLTHPTGGDQSLFGSDIRHSSRLRIEIKRATLERGLSNDWIHGREIIACVELSAAQFAQFITSQGSGNGTPCTIRCSGPKDAGLVEAPGIEMHETKHETFRREVEDAARERVTSIADKVARLGAMVESGKVGKKELREIHAELKRNAAQLAGSLGFVVEQAQEAIEKATTAAKIEIEAHISNEVRKIGLQHIEQLGQIAVGGQMGVLERIEDFDKRGQAD